MKRWTAVIIALLALLATTAVTPVRAENGSVKVAYVDLEEVLQSDSDYRRAMEELKQFKQDLQNRIDSEKQELSQMQETLKEESSLLSEQELQQKRQKFMRRMRAFRERAQRSQILMQRKKQELLAPIIDRIEPAVRAVARDRDYDVIRTFGQSNDSVLWVSERVDITDAVVRRLKGSS